MAHDIANQVGYGYEPYIKFKSDMISLKSIKHFLWSIVNISLDFIPINIIKNFILKNVFLFDIGMSSSIHVGFRFYRLRNFSIGDYSVINRGFTLDNRGPVSIGKGVSISRYVTFYTAGHRSDSDFTMWMDQIKVSDYCVIYSNAIILPGVILSDGCIVYPGSVVYRGNYPKGSVLSGNPAKIIKTTSSIVSRSHDYPHLYAM